MFLSFPVRSLIPLLIGMCVGLWYSMVFSPIEDVELCVPDTRASVEPTHVPVVREIKNITTVKPKTPKPVPPKASQFNYDFRPYFVYSELGFKLKLVVGILTTERQLDTFGVAINNTWLKDIPKVLFFTSYSKNIDFHDKYNRRMNLNVIQLPDISDESSHVDLSFRMWLYMRDHFSETYEWFMQVSESAYINSENLLSFLYSINSSQDYILGHARQTNTEHIHPKHIPTTENPEKSSYCISSSGIILSRSALLKVVPHLRTCATGSSKDSTGDLELANCIKQTSDISCVASKETRTLFHRHPAGSSINDDVKSDQNLGKAAVLYPISRAEDMLRTHKHFTRKKLLSSYERVKEYQDTIKKLTPKIPKGVPEKTLHWPIGFKAPFKPVTRFEVIPWTYFTPDRLFGGTDLEPVSDWGTADREDLNDILNTVQKVIRKKNPTVYEKAELLNGYRRLDPLRGSEYILDMKAGDKMQRFHLLRPFTKVEALQMPAATEQRGIHLVLPVTREDTGRFEKFLQMYKRVCLQTGENVVLLTVFINLRESPQDDEHNDPFVESKNLIARYKRSYMWAQLPWLQVGVKTQSLILIMDIVSMKLPVNSLIFLVSLTIDFTINFLNRCRVNVVSGIQVFFPIPFAEYNPKIVYKNKQKPTFVDIHVTTGIWDIATTDIACFSNKDYKELRMRKDDFLNEEQPSGRDILDVFYKTKIAIFRAVDSELRRRYVPMFCSKSLNSTAMKRCMGEAGKRCASRKQLAQLILESHDVVELQ